MITDLDLFKSLVAPSGSRFATDADWHDVESRLGVGLPTDYKEFISVYGTGSLQTFLHIWNSSDNRMADPLKGIVKVFSQLEYCKKAGKPLEFKPFPDQGNRMKNDKVFLLPLVFSRKNENQKLVRSCRTVSRVKNGCQFF